MKEPTLSRLQAVLPLLASPHIKRLALPDALLVWGISRSTYYHRLAAGIYQTPLQNGRLLYFSTDYVREVLENPPAVPVAKKDESPAAVVEAPPPVEQMTESPVELEQTQPESVERTFPCVRTIPPVSNPEERKKRGRRKKIQAESATA